MVITFPRLVVAAISVKATMRKAFVEDSVKGLNALRSVLSGQIDPSQVWCGGYYYQPDETVSNNPAHAVRYIRDALVAYPVTPAPLHSPVAAPGVHSSGQNLAVKLVPSDGGQTRLIGYRCPGTATALFVAELLSHAAARRGEMDSDYARLADDDGYEVLPAGS